MNNLLLILGIIALSNGNVSLFNNDNNKGEKIKKSKNRNQERGENALTFDASDIKNGMKLMELSDDDLERGMEIILRTKKYMSPDERKILVKIESVLDLVRGIKKLGNIESDEYEESNFFRSMDEEDKKNMMIKEILDVFPEKKKVSLEKAIDIKKKIDLFAELFLPDDIGENGFSLSSLINIDNLGSMGNLSLLGNLLRSDDINVEEKDEDEKNEEEND